MKKYLHPFEPIVDENSKYLILGSFPSFDSFKYDFYYANKYNVFWKIISQIFSKKVETKNEKTVLLQQHHIALWDIIHSCERDSSLDTKLKNIQLNDIRSLLKKYPSITKVGCNGKKCYDLFIKNFQMLDVEVLYLPSTSSANARMKLEDKLNAFKDFLEYKEHNEQI